MAKRQTKKTATTANLGFEAKLWAAADVALQQDFPRNDRAIAAEQAWGIDLDAPESDDGPAVNQFTSSDGQYTRRSDVVLPLSDGSKARRSG